MARPLTKDRKARILDAAEDAFADFGFEGASLRQIVLQAGVNLATVYYYYQSKHGLMEQVLERRFGSLREEQLHRLKVLQAQAGGRPLAVERILEAMLLPPLRLALTPSAKRQACMRLIGRIVTEPNPQTQAMLRCRHQDVRTAFFKAMQQSLPEVPAPNLRWRMEFVWGALAFILCNPRRIEQETQGAWNPAQTQKLLREMITFFSSGFRAGIPNGNGKYGKYGNDEGGNGKANGGRPAPQRSRRSLLAGRGRRRK